MRDQHRHELSRGHRGTRRLRRPGVAGLVAFASVAMSVGVGASASAAAPPVGPIVVATAVDPSAAGSLRTTTVGLDAPAGAGRSAGDAHRPGWTTVAPVPAGTQQVGISWAGDARAEFQLRTRRTVGGAWSAPTTVAGDPEEAPDGPSARAAVGPLWLGATGVAAIEVRLTEGLVSAVRLDAMTFTPAADAGAGGGAGASPGVRVAPITIARPATPAGGPPIRLRSSWAPGGWQPDHPGCTPAPVIDDQLQHAVVHHTDTPNTYAAADVPGILAGIYRYHTATRGWCDIAYNLFVDRFGNVWEGRSGGLDQAVQGGHAQGFNRASVGIALIGTHQPGGAFPASTPSSAELTALRDVLAWKLGSQGTDPRGRADVVSTGNARYAEGAVVSLPTVGGHGDNGFTTCPGDLVRSRFAQLRLDVAARIAATNDPSRWGPFTTGARYWTQVLTDAEGTIAAPSRIGTLTSRVVRAGTSQADLTTGAVLSTRTDRRIGVVDRLYRAAFGRNPDTAGLKANIAHRDAGMATAALAHNFLISSEFKQRHGSLSDAAFTALLFHNALGREATPHDVDHWAPLLADGLAREDMLVTFSESAEAKARAAVPTKVTTAFYVMVRRVPTDASRLYWEPRLRTGTPTRDLVLGLLRGAEYRARF